MKKITLALGSLVSIAAPVSAVVACGSTETKGSTETNGFSYQSADAVVSRGTSTKSPQGNVAAQASSATPQSIVDLGSSIASYVKGVYTYTPAAAGLTDVKAPKSIDAIAKANVLSQIAGTGHYSVLINLLKDELTDAEALIVHKAFVTAYNSKLITSPKENDLDAKALYTALKTAADASSALAAKLNFGMFK